MTKSVIFYLMLLAFLPTFIASTSHQHHHHHKHHHHHHNDGLKSIQLTLYQQDTINKTDFLVVPGMGGSNVSVLTSPFGSMSVLNDKLTISPHPSSKVLGHVEGIAITATFDGLQGFSFGRFNLNLEDGLKGSISINGAFNGLNPIDYSVAGGTGDFLFVQGFITTTPLSFEGTSSVYKHEVHLIWPPYAAKAISMLSTSASKQG